MPKLTVNGLELEVPQGTSVLQACEQLGIEIPRFCYHDKLSVPANCRMCLVEIEKTPKPVASCAMPCADGMIVHTDSAMVHKARSGVMEMLLINHPLDCPICDQGGECDLQDQAVAYGLDRSRYEDTKRSVKDKNFGPLVKTVMTRCIHCTRCIRFVDEIGGAPELGLINRGERAEVTNFIEQALTSELSGNLVDICPVGALTSKPGAFTARPWEYQKTDSIDVLDAVGSNIRIDARGREVMRILPRLNEDVNEEWINDKTRYACDGLMRQRLDRPYLRKDGRLREISWDEALSVLAERLKVTPKDRIAALAGDLVDVESVFSLKLLLTSLGVGHLDCRQDGAQYDVSTRAAYLLNTGIAGIEAADALLLVGTNPRHEAALINARIRKRWLSGGFRVGLIGTEVNLGYPYQRLGNSPDALTKIMTGRLEFSKVLSSAKNPMVMVGAGALARRDGPQLHSLIRELAEKYGMVRDDWNGFNVLQMAAGRVGALDIGFLPASGCMGTNAILQATSEGKLDFVYLLGADEIAMDRLGSSFVVYQGHHGDAGAHRADLILPGAAYTEKSGIYVNTEGRAQLAQAATSPPGDAKVDWSILRALSEKLEKPLPYNSLYELRAVLFEKFPKLAEIGQRTHSQWGSFGVRGELTPDVFSLPVKNFYMTDPISRSSETMAACTNEIIPLTQATAAE